MEEMKRSIPCYDRTYQLFHFIVKLRLQKSFMISYSEPILINTVIMLDRRELIHW